MERASVVAAGSEAVAAASAAAVEGRSDQSLSALPFSS